MIRALLDINIILDTLLAREPFGFRPPPSGKRMRMGDLQVI